MKKVVFTKVNITEDLYAEIKSYCDKHGLKLSQFLRSAAYEYIAAHGDAPVIVLSQAQARRIAD